METYYIKGSFLRERRTLIKNKKNQSCYILEGVLGCKDAVLILYDMNGVEQARLRQVNHYFPITCSIYLKGKYMGSVRRVRTFFQELYVVTHLNWFGLSYNSQSDLKFFDFKNCLMRVQKKNRLPLVYQVDIETHLYHPICLLLAVALENWSRMGQNISALDYLSDALLSKKVIQSQCSEIYPISDIEEKRNLEFEKQKL